MAFPERIVCLTAETAELAFALGCSERVVGVTGYAVRPPEVRQKPRVAAFRTAAIDRILALRPDLVLGFSDLQASIAAELIQRGVTVLVTNQRTLTETYDAMLLIARVLDAVGEGERLVAEMQTRLRLVAANAPAQGPVVYFEEWDVPMITGIAWVGELIQLAGGRDAFPEKRAQDAGSRIVTSEDVVQRRPEIIVASWCGKKANLERIRNRPGWSDIPAVKHGQIYEIKAPDILQPGLSLVHGAEQLGAMIRKWADSGSWTLGPE